MGSLPDFRVFVCFGLRTYPRACTAPLASFTLFFRVHQRSSCLPSPPVSRFRCSAPSVESLAPSVLSHMQQRLFRGPDLPARAFSPPGVLNLMAPSSTACLPALFHAGSTLGVLPFRAFSPGLPGSSSLDMSSRTPPLAQHCVVSNAFALLSLSRSFLRLVSCRPSDFSASGKLGLQPSKRLSPTGPCSTPESATSCRWFRPTRAHGSHGLSCSSGSSPTLGTTGPSPDFPSRAF